MPKSVQHVFNIKVLHCLSASLTRNMVGAIYFRAVPCHLEEASAGNMRSINVPSCPLYTPLITVPNHSATSCALSLGREQLTVTLLSGALDGAGL